MFFKLLGSSNPTRLFVAGIHGDEEAITRPVFEMMIKAEKNFREFFKDMKNIFFF